MPRIVAMTLIVAAIALVAGCSPSIRVQTDWDEGADFSRLKSFDILDNGSISDPLISRRIANAVQVHLEERGFVKDAADPDFRVAFYTNVQDRIDVTTWGYTTSPRHWHGSSNVTVTQYQVGTLFIDIIDARQNELIWRGWGSGTLGSSTREAHVLQDAVDRILKRYPPN